MKQIIYITITSLVLCSCSIYSKFSTPELEQTNLCREHIIATDSFIAPPQWQQLFVDTLLQELIQIGLKNNSDIRIANLNIEKAQAALLSSKLAYIPSLNFTPDAGISSFKGNSSGWAYSLPVNAQWEVDIFGKLRNNKEMAKASLQEAKYYSNLVESQIITAIANAYYTLIMLDEQMRIISQSTELYKQSLEIITAMKQVGMQTEAAVNQATASYLNIKASQIDLYTQINATQNALSLLLNMPPREIKRSAYADALIADIDIQQGISLVALANRPDVKVAEATLSNSFYAVNLANAAFYPSIKLGGTIGWTNSAGALISNPAGWLFSAIASLTQPIFNGGANRANLKIAKTQYEQSLIAFHKALLVAGTEVNDAISILQGSDAQAQLRKEQVIATQKAYDNSIQIMQNSSQTYLEVIASQGALLEAQIAELGNWMQGVQGRITLFKALGGGI